MPSGGTHSHDKISKEYNLLGSYVPEHKYLPHTHPLDIIDNNVLKWHAISHEKIYLGNMAKPILRKLF